MVYMVNVMLYILFVDLENVDRVHCISKPPNQQRSHIAVCWEHYLESNSDIELSRNLLRKHTTNSKK